MQKSFKWAGKWAILKVETNDCFMEAEPPPKIQSTDMIKMMNVIKYLQVNIKFTECTHMACSAVWFKISCPFIINHHDQYDLVLHHNAHSVEYVIGPSPIFATGFC